MIVYVAVAILLGSADGILRGPAASDGTGLISGRLGGLQLPLTGNHLHAFRGQPVHGDRGHHVKRNVKRLLPIFYLHFPKCGTSFAGVLARFVCHTETMVLYSESDLESHWPPLLQLPDYAGMAVPCARLADTYSPEKVDPSLAFLDFRSNHVPLKDASLAHHVTVMFRSPKQRIVSGYYHDLHDCESLRGPGDALNVSLVDYAHCAGNCMTNMLTGRTCAERVEPGDIHHQRRQALALVHQLSFVGLTDHWALSMCLFHAMFGGECYESNFSNSRPGAFRHGSEAYDVAALEGFVPPDEEVYEEATRVFWRRVKTFGLSEHVCRKHVCRSAGERAYFPTVS
mmetsp:Transcript_117011/g.331133  ORF Transcript_117011/g.331133 Transcript_117011/m.331133 type:complete len:342 (-) Transcript_117011:7-1032(-)